MNIVIGSTWEVIPDNQLSELRKAFSRLLKPYGFTMSLNPIYSSITIKMNSKPQSYQEALQVLENIMKFLEIKILEELLKKNPYLAIQAPEEHEALSTGFSLLLNTYDPVQRLNKPPRSEAFVDKIYVVSDEAAGEVYCTSKIPADVRTLLETFELLYRSVIISMGLHHTDEEIAYFQKILKRPNS